MRKRPALFTRFDEEELGELLVQAIEDCHADLVAGLDESKQSRRMAVSDMLDCAQNQLYHVRTHPQVDVEVARDYERQFDKRSDLRTGDLAADVLLAFRDYAHADYKWAHEAGTRALTERFGAKRGWVRL